MRTARAKGLAERLVMRRHVLRNAWLPTLTILGFSFAQLLTASVLTETIFQWNGIGSYAVQSANTLDFPGINGVSLFGGLAFLLANLATDVLYASRRSEDPLGMSLLSTEPRLARSRVTPALDVEVAVEARPGDRRFDRGLVLAHRVDHAAAGGPRTSRSRPSARRLQPPSWHHLFGTDALEPRRVHADAVRCSRRRLPVSVAVIVAAVAIGTIARLARRLLRRLGRRAS